MEMKTSSKMKRKKKDNNQTFMGKVISRKLSIKNQQVQSKQKSTQRKTDIMVSGQFNIMAYWNATNRNQVRKKKICGEKKLQDYYHTPPGWTY